MAVRTTHWVDSLINISVTSGSQAAISLATSMSTTDSRGVTIIRTIYDLYLQSETVAGAWGSSSSHLLYSITPYHRKVKGGRISILPPFRAPLPACCC